MILNIALSFSSLYPILVFPVAIFSLAYMVSVIIQSNSLKMLAKSELIEYIIFIILLMALISFLSSNLFNTILGLIVNQIQDSLAVGNINPLFSSTPISREDLMEAAENSIDKNSLIMIKLLDTHSSFLRKATALASISDSVSFFSSKNIRDINNDDISRRIATENPSADAQISFSSCSGYNSVVNTFTALSDYFGMAIMALEFQKLLLQVLSSDTAVSVMIAIGVLLRTNPITRSVGAFFVALGLGLYTIMPFSVLVANEAVYTFYSNENILSVSGGFYEDINIEYSTTIFESVSRCSPGSIEDKLNSIKNNIATNEDASMITSFIFFVILAQGVTLLTFVSIVGGISAAFGAEISPYIIGRLTYYLSGG